MKLKHLFIPSMALFMGLGMASCSNDDNEPELKGQTVDVTFKAVLPSTLARADYGTGTKAKKLQWAVFNENMTKKVLEGTGEFPADALQTDVEMQLVTGDTYQIVFWAQNADAPYTFTTTDSSAKVTADYPAANNQEELDAFYNRQTLTVTNGNLTPTAELKRPFAQLNIATADKDVVSQTGTWPTTSSVTLSGVPTGFDLINQTCTGSGTEVTFSAASLPEGQITVNGTPYDYLSMTYIFAPKEGEVANVGLTVNNIADGQRSYANIPLRQNYRTNIVGNLLTSNVLYNVYIEPTFDVPPIEPDKVVTNAAEFAEALASGEQNVYVNGSFAYTNDIPSNVNIIGLGTNANGTPSSTIRTHHMIVGSNVSITNMAFTHDGTAGTSADRTNGTILYMPQRRENVTIDGCVFTPSSAFYANTGNLGMIYMQNMVPGLKVINSTFNTYGFNMGAGWAIWGATKGTAENPVVIKNNNFRGGGVCLEGIEAYNWENINIENNQFNGSRKMRIVPNNAAINISNLIIKDNTLTSIEVYGMNVGTVEKIYIVDNSNANLGFSFVNTSDEIQAKFNNAIIRTL